VEVHQELLSDSLADRLGTFDAVLLVHVLEHLPEPERMLQLVRRLLKPGGIFFCEVPNDFNPLQEAAVSACGLKPWWIALPDHLNYFSISSLASFIEGHGFEVLLRTTDFPVEMFLLWGDVYIGNPEAGRQMHEKRCRFEEAMRRAGKEEVLRGWYERTAELNVGRQAIVCGRRR
jgi:SAM-dependent methyltransferase